MPVKEISICIICVLAVSVVNSPAFATDVGNGADGPGTVSANKNLYTESICGRGTPDAVTTTSTTNVASGQNQITVASVPAGLSIGDEILIINLKQISAGAPTDEVGKYEFKRITNINGAILTLDNNLTNSYDGTTHRIMVQRMPNYTDVTINQGCILTVNAWNGTSGGVLAFRTTGTLLVNGTISTTGCGYGSGNGASYNGNATGGETYNGRGGNGGTYAQNGFTGQGGGGAGGFNNGTAYSGTVGNTGGGGSGGGGYNRPGATYTGIRCGGGGGGGGYVTSGGYGKGGNDGTGGNSTTGGSGGNGGNEAGGGGAGGGSYGISNLSSKMYFGSGGGGGGGGSGYITCGAAGANGGKGGGIIYIVAEKITVISTGNIIANGTNGLNSSWYIWAGGGGGGAGAGGSIFVRGKQISNSGNIIANGGNGGTGGSSGSAGGNGGSGQTFIIIGEMVESSEWTDLLNGNPVKMSQSIAHVKFNIKSEFGTARWKRFRIDKGLKSYSNTACPDSKIEVQVWCENNNNGFWDSSDTFISKGNFTNGTCWLNMKRWQVTTQSRTYYIVYKLAGDIGGGQRAGVKIADSSYLEFENATCIGVP